MAFDEQRRTARENGRLMKKFYDRYTWEARASESIPYLLSTLLSLKKPPRPTLIECQRLKQLFFSAKI